MNPQTYITWIFCVSLRSSIFLWLQPMRAEDAVLGKMNEFECPFTSIYKVASGIVVFFYYVHCGRGDDSDLFRRMIFASRRSKNSSLLIFLEDCVERVPHVAPVLLLLFSLSVALKDGDIPVMLWRCFLIVRYEAWCHWIGLWECSVIPFDARVGLDVNARPPERNARQHKQSRIM